jgi:hypothetical protein
VPIAVAVAACRADETVARDERDVQHDIDDKHRQIDERGAGLLARHGQEHLARTDKRLGHDADEQHRHDRLSALKGGSKERQQERRRSQHHAAEEQRRPEGPDHRLPREQRQRGLVVGGDEGGEPRCGRRP